MTEIRFIAVLTPVHQRTPRC